MNYLLDNKKTGQTIHILKISEMFYTQKKIYTFYSCTKADKTEAWRIHLYITVYIDNAKSNGKFKTHIYVTLHVLYFHFFYPSHKQSKIETILV